MSHVNYVNSVRTNTDFNVIQYGWRACSPSFAARYFIRPTYLLHYVYSGSGYLEADGVKFNVAKNQAFLIFPGQLTTYVSSADNPLEYRWIEFYGNKAEEFAHSASLSTSSPIFTDTPPFECGEALKRIVERGEMSSYALTGMFWDFAATMAHDETPIASVADLYVEKAKNFIHSKFFRITSVSDVANHLNLNRSYFTRLFKEQTGQTPKQYILQYHMDVAKNLLASGQLSVHEVAEAVGYDNPIDFTKAFTRFVDMPPSAYRKIYSAHREKLKNDTYHDED